MTDHPHRLCAVEFTEADQARVVGFSCGEEAWARHVAEWIRGSDVLDSMRRGTKVWLFETARGEIVGFGSLGSTRWRWPPPDGSPTAVLLIPMLGLSARFQGQPPDPEWRFARQIMSHMVSEAKAMSRQAAEESGTPIGWLVLLVHRDNERAIRFYEKCGFELIPGVVRRNDHLVMKLWIGESES
jgi:ribosomal protein S18 acetylase RimI-like enzyme